MKWNEWVSGLSGTEFVTAHIEEGLSLVDINEAWLLDAAARGHAIYPYFTLAKESVSADASQYSLPALLSGVRLVTGSGLRAGLDQGYTLKTQFLETYKPELIEMINPIQRTLRGRSTVYGFLTPADTRGLSVHRDASSVIVLQVEGRKSWHVWEPEPGSVVPSAAGLTSSPPGHEHTFTLAPGDAMFMPFGWPHAAEATGDGSSFHLTWTIDHLNPAQLGHFIDQAKPPLEPDATNLLRDARTAYRFGG